MKLSHLVLAAASALLISSAAVVSAAPGDNPPAMGSMNGGGGSGMRGMFTSEERMMMFADGYKATSAMTDDQKKAYRDERRAKIMAMSDADRAKFKADLDTRWAALPADEKASITAKVQAFMAARHAGGGGGQ